MSPKLDTALSDNDNLPIESKNEASETTSKKDYVLLALVTLIKFGDSIEIYLPGVITQKASCELGVSDFQEGLLAVIFYLVNTIANLLSFPISAQLQIGRETDNDLVLVLIDRFCIFVCNSSQLLHTSSLPSLNWNMCRFE